MGERKGGSSVDKTRTGYGGCQDFPAVGDVKLLIFRRMYEGSWRREEIELVREA